MPDETVIDGEVVALDDTGRWRAGKLPTLSQPLDGWNSKTPEDPVGLLRTQSSSANQPPDKNAEEPTRNELSERLPWNGAAVASWKHRLYVVTNQIQQNLVQHLLNHGTALLAHHRLKHIAVLVHVRENFLAKRQYPLVKAAAVRQGLALAFLKGRSQSLEPAQQEIFLIVEMCVERCPAHVGTVNDVLHREPLKSPLLDQRQQRSSEELLRPLHTSIYFPRHPFTLEFSNVPCPLVQIQTNNGQLSVTLAET